jgi:hypothetical protein
MTETLTRGEPLALILPLASDRAAWQLIDETVATDTGQVVYHYRHGVTLQCLRLDSAGRVYGRDAEGAVRLFGRGGPLALHVAINIVFDQHPDLRPQRIVVPRRAR